ncbi:MAG: hypothetical protein ACRDVP_12025 [Acidimicrobiales bacterium]
MTITTNHPADARHDGAVTNQTEPDPEVPERARPPRRSWQRAPREDEDPLGVRALSKAEKGALLRREGLYSSLLTEWHRQRAKVATRPSAVPPDARRPISGTKRSPR